MHVGSYLRGARESRHLTIAEISQRTKIHCGLLVDLENNDLSHWPRHRIYRHGHLRSYAEAVGLDPKAVLDRFDDEFGDPYPAPFHGRPRTKSRKLVAPPIVRSGLVVGSMVIFIGGILTVLDATRSRVAAKPAPVAQIDKHTADIPGVLRTAASSDVSSDVTRNDELVVDKEIEGELRIISRPEQARVTVNGTARGETPLRVRYLPLGSYTVRVIQPGYKIAQTVVTLRSEQPNQTVRVVLRDEPMSARATLDASRSTP
jgi:cytoskeletal protein RodZ